jgi:hypothetical protein
VGVFSIGYLEIIINHRIIPQNLTASIPKHFPLHLLHNSDTITMAMYSRWNSFENQEAFCHHYWDLIYRHMSTYQEGREYS